jgi:hypothetical protein
MSRQPSTGKYKVLLLTSVDSLHTFLLKSASCACPTAAKCNQSTNIGVRSEQCTRSAIRQRALACPFSDSCQSMTWSRSSHDDQCGCTYLKKHASIFVGQMLLAVLSLSRRRSRDGGPSIPGRRAKDWRFNTQLCNDNNTAANIDCNTSRCF